MPYLSVYNNLIQGHVIMRQTRFDTHKRSELKDIYQRIRKMNVDQPFYKVTFDSKTQEYTLGVKDKAIDLSSMLKELGSDDVTNNVFNQKTLVSDAPKAVTVESIDGSGVDEMEPMTVEVDSLSEAQVNTGRFLPSGDVNLADGQYTFTVGIEDSYYSFQFNVAAGSTNKELQTKLSDFINKTKVGLSARVISNNGMSAIELVSKAGGTKNPDGISFEFEDTKFPENAVRGIVGQFGLNKVAKPAVNTCFRVNGEYIETSEREYVLNNGIKLDFHDTTENPVTISAVVDDAPVIEKVSGFVDRLNAFLDFVKEGSAERRSSRKLLFEMSNVMERYKGQFAENGFKINDDGKLEIDKETMIQAIREGSMEQFFGPDSMVSASLLRRFADVTINPMDYIDKTVITYPNTAVKQPYSPYVTSVYSGLMYNNYC
ncbi:MAG: hypothetical protein MJ124_01030 [Lachnospiraceae bacterium]|nr:hypothetical protein [Lachnospiraceae bacterium]